MLVQLSPWQSVKTSLPTGKGKRARKRNDNRGSDSHFHHNDPSFATSFVPPVRRSSKRLKGQSALHLKDDMVPSITITSGHRISVLGRMSKFSHPDQHQDAAPQFQESAQWQYSSRPGQITSFLQEPLVNGNSKKHHHPCIPAILDAKNNWVYALQHDNGTLCCWDATRASGPDDSNSSSTVTKIKLKTPALSLSLNTFKTGIVYGTCLDGSVFLGRWICNSQGRPQKFQVSYLESPPSRGDHHVFTAGKPALDIKENAGQKRKANEGEHSTISFHQMFLSDRGTLRMVKHELPLPPDNDVRPTVDAHRVQEVLIGPMHSIQVSPIDVHSSIACSMDDRNVALLYHSRRRDSPWKCACVHVCLETGRLIRAPFVLPVTVRHAGALSSSILVLGTSDAILFCDVVHGATVHSIPVKKKIREGEWYLAADKKTRRIVVLSCEGDHIQASITTASLNATILGDRSKRVRSSLATELRSSLATSVRSSLKRPDSKVGNLMNIEDLSGVDAFRWEHSVNRHLSLAIDRALERLKDCCRRILDPSTGHLEPHFFLTEYERALETVLLAANMSRTAMLERKVPPKQVSHTAEVADNPQDAIPSSRESPKNATPDLQSDKECSEHENGWKREKLVNGMKTNTELGWFGRMRAHTPTSTPQLFVDSATPIVLSTLQLPRVDDWFIGQRVQSARLDARVILSRLVQTRKVSARLHFESHGKSRNYFLSVLRSLKMSRKRERVFTPVDLMHDMLTYCSDVSEQLMVTMLHYMFCRALPEDAAENLIETGGLNLSDRIISKRYFNARTKLVRAVSQSNAHRGSSDAKQIGELQTDVDNLANKVLKAGAAFLVSRFATYSTCNETLLRGALLEGLPVETEPALLAYVLTDLLSVASRDSITFRNPRYSKLRTSCPSIARWITALCDAYRDKLLEEPIVSNGSGSAEESPMEHVRRAIGAAVKQTEATMSLRDGYEHSMADIYSQAVVEKGNDEEAAPFKFLDEEKEDAAIPPYTIEDLIF